MSQSIIELPDFPIAVVGAGPVGLAAASHLAQRDLPFVVLEAGAQPAAAIREWAHVPLFTPWGYTVDPVAAEMLSAAGWTAPDPDAFPTDGDLVRHYLDPLATHPAIAPHLRLNHRVTAISRHQLGKLEENRESHPFLLEMTDANSQPQTLLASGVIDASGTWHSPNPLGANGCPVPGEREFAGAIAHGVPDVAGAQRERYAGKRTLVVGGGHSAFHILRELVRLGQEAPDTEVHWALRREATAESLAVCADDPLTERTLIRRDVAELLADEAIQAHPGARLTLIRREASGLVAMAGDRALPPVDEIVVATGFRPDHRLASELRLDIQSVYESTYELAPLIDPDASACGTVPPHGVRELAHPEPGYYAVGAKSYGRAPTFLLFTGYEQVRSVVCAFDGDEAALEVRLQLPERGLCSACTAFLDARDASATCGCGEAEADDCCVDESDAVAAA